MNSSFPPAVSRDPDDDYLIALARAAGVSDLVSRDQDLLSLELEDVRVISPAEFLASLLPRDHP